MERRETSTTIHPDQVLAKCANGQMETRLAVLCLRLTNRIRTRPRLGMPWELRTDGIRLRQAYGATGSMGHMRPMSAHLELPFPGGALIDQWNPAENLRERGRRRVRIRLVSLLAPGFWLLAPLLSGPAELRQRHHRIRMQRANPVKDLGSQTRGSPVGGKDYF